MNLTLKPFVIMKLFGLFSLFGCQSGKIVSESAETSGPLEIAWKVTQGRSGSWFNNGGNFNAKKYTSLFTVACNRTAVSIPFPSPEKPTQAFWQAYFLKDAPTPSVLAAVHSMYLITEENGSAVVSPLHEQEGDFAKWQWLDSDQGQPGPMNLITLGDHSTSPRFLSGGRYLMVNSKVVLDVKTLKQYPFDLIDYNVLQQLESYHAGNSFVAQFSPGQTQMVFIGNRDHPENRMRTQYGLVVVDFIHDSVYAVPFDRTATRFFSIWDADQTWMNTYFEWSTDDAGRERIRLRKYDQLPYWQGRWLRPENSDEFTDYELMPVDTPMFPVFAQFVREHLSVTKESREEIPSYQGSTNNEPSCILVTITFETAEGMVRVYTNPYEQKITLSSANIGLVQKLGRLFDAELAKGKYQVLFGSYP